jgi:hypothetical protein
MNRNGLEERATARLVWGYFRLGLPTTKGKLLKGYKEACDRMRPGASKVVRLVTNGVEEVIEVRFASNTKAEFVEMKDFYHDLMKASPPWAFVAGEELRHEPRQRRPGRGRFHPNPRPR